MRTAPPPRKETKPVAPVKGFPVRLVLEMEAPLIGCGNRLVTVQFRTVKRKKNVEKFVVLHSAGYTDTIRAKRSRRWLRQTRNTENAGAHRSSSS